MAHVGFGVWGRTVSKAGALSLWFQWFLLSWCNYQAAFLVFSVLSSLLDTRKWSCVIWPLFLIRVLVMIWQVWVKLLLHHFPAITLCSGVGDSNRAQVTAVLCSFERLICRITGEVWLFHTLAWFQGFWQSERSGSLPRNVQPGVLTLLWVQRLSQYLPFKPELLYHYLKQHFLARRLLLGFPTFCFLVLFFFCN